MGLKVECIWFFTLRGVQQITVCALEFFITPLIFPLPSHSHAPQYEGQTGGSTVCHTLPLCGNFPPPPPSSSCATRLERTRLQSAEQREHQGVLLALGSAANWEEWKGAILRRDNESRCRATSRGKQAARGSPVSCFRSLLSSCCCRESGYLGRRGGALDLGCKQGREAFRKTASVCAPRQLSQSFLDDTGRGHPPISPEL